MILLPEQIKNAVESFRRLPGVGEKTALRQILSMSNWHHNEIELFASSMRELSSLKYCKECGLFADLDLCQICLNDQRNDEKMMCIVESYPDLMAIERSQQFKGTYHILGGVLNPLSGVGPEELNISYLIERIKAKNIHTIILAINPSVEGDATCSYIKNELNESINIERIGFGIPMGGSLEYLDPLTIGIALENRKQL